MTNSTDKKIVGKTFKGTVVSDKMDKTVVVEVATFKQHAKYGKFQTRHKKFKAHDEANTCKVGDVVTIKEVKPISKDKNFIVIK
ncbi:MAG: small subunit ribosomal protein [Patescibacteria group bacterium]|nr:small subunit ribosomal protein [Patescibacteria group bacterium]